MKSLGKRLPLFVALALGWIIGGFSASSPTAVAQVARVTLDSLQTQVNNIVGGTTTVAKATTATNALNATTAASAPWSGLTGVPASIADGDQGVTTAGTGLSINGTGISVSFPAFDSRYLSLAGGSLTGPVNVQGSLSAANFTTSGTLTATGGIQLPVAAASFGSPASSTGMLRYNTTIGKLEVSNGFAWIAVH